MKGETKQNKGINIDSKELVIALNELEKEKGIKKDYMLESIETALVTAYKRNYDSNADNVKVTMHPESGEIHVIAEMEVVETVEDDKTQINLEDSREKVKNLLKDANENGVKISHQAPTLYDVVPKEEIAEFEELMRKTIADIVSEASSVACWVYVQKYVKHKTLNEMLQELPDVSQFILAMDTWFEKLMEK